MWFDGWGCFDRCQPFLQSRRWQYDCVETLSEDYSCPCPSRWLLRPTLTSASGLGCMQAPTLAQKRAVLGPAQLSKAI
jgi:hypothetical protein